MNLRYLMHLLGLSVGLLPLVSMQAPASGSVVAQTTSGCPQSAFSRLIRHKVAPGETLESIATKYNLIPATLLGMNPALRTKPPTVGSEIVVPPFNGIRVEVPAGQTWRQIAAQYRVRADVLFEANGCQNTPQVVFVPGVNWSPAESSPTANSLTGYPLATKATLGLRYGWQINPSTGDVFFHSGIDLLAAVGTSVQAIGAGTVAFAGEQGNYGNLVVVNHQGGQQTRYAHLQNIAVKVGQTVQSGQQLGSVGVTGMPTLNQPHLHFEVRSTSSLGWVAQDPIPSLK